MYKINVDNEIILKYCYCMMLIIGFNCRTIIDQLGKVSPLLSTPASFMSSHAIISVQAVAEVVDDSTHF